MCHYSTRLGFGLRADRRTLTFFQHWPLFFLSSSVLYGGNFAVMLPSLSGFKISKCIAYLCGTLHWETALFPFASFPQDQYIITMALQAVSELFFLIRSLLFIQSHSFVFHKTTMLGKRRRDSYRYSRPCDVRRLGQMSRQTNSCKPKCALVGLQAINLPVSEGISFNCHSVPTSLLPSGVFRLKTKQRSFLQLIQYKTVLTPNTVDFYSHLKSKFKSVRSFDTHRLTCSNLSIESNPAVTLERRKPMMWRGRPAGGAETPTNEAGCSS